MNPIKLPEAAVFPPWGIQTVSDIAATQENFGIPKDFKIGQGISGGALRNAWNQFVADTLKVVGTAVWPQYDFSIKDWPAGTEEMRRAITEADLNIMAKFQDPAADMMNQLVQSPVAGPVRSTHQQHFEREDDSILGRMHAEYDATLSAERLARIPVLIVAGLDNKMASTSKQLKRHLQRPRPYQMAQVAGMRNFRHHHADSADSPSMNSGHGLAGMISVGAVINEWLKSGFAEDDSFVALQHYAVDIGDRRVYAGVHYPADNLASWIIALRLGKEVFESTKTLHHLWEAITQRSLVYAAIKDFPGDAYAKGLQLLHDHDPT